MSFTVLRFLIQLSDASKQLAKSGDFTNYSRRTGLSGAVTGEMAMFQELSGKPNRRL